jgi:acyl-CoA thioesterase
MLTLDDLELDGAAGTYRRQLGEGWTYADRIFGGYTAGLALTAAQRKSPHAAAVGAHITFLDAARPGSLTLQVSTLREGRRTWCGQVIATQAGHPVLTCTAWFGERAVGPPSDGSPGSRPRPPEECPSLDWVADMWPCIGFLDERAIDYPTGPEEIGDGSRVEVWSRPAVPLGPDPFLVQAFELMLADAHTLDAAIRRTGLAGTLGVSLDLTVSWQRPTPLPGWIRLSAEAGPAGDGFVTCTGSLHDQDGNLRVSVQTNGRILIGT